jgi:hypothetical protein
MTQEIGRVERPSAENYRGKRKLLLVPLMYGPPDVAPEGLAIVERYWEQVRAQTNALEGTLGSLRHIFCETLAAGGPEGLEHLQHGDRHSFQFVQTKCTGGAVLQPTEDQDILLETLDLQRFLMLPLASEKVARRVHDWFAETNKSRYQYIAQRIDTTLGQDETGLLLISERHQVQFPADIEVFYVAPPALDEYRRWLRNWAARREQPPQGGDDASDSSAAAASEEASKSPTNQ